jgi:hypothetical protein
VKDVSIFNSLASLNQSIEEEGNKEVIKKQFIDFYYPRDQLEKLLKIDKLNKDDEQGKKENEFDFYRTGF